MSAVLTRRRTGRARDRDRQPSLFSQLVSPPAREADRRVERGPEAATTVEDGPLVGGAPAPADIPTGADHYVTSARTLDEAISSLWAGLVAGEPGDCPVCGAAMQPRHSAGAGVVGGRCGSCATTLA